MCVGMHPERGRPTAKWHSKISLNKIRLGEESAPRKHRAAAGSDPDFARDKWPIVDSIKRAHLAELT